MEEIIFILSDDRHKLCVKKWRYVQSTSKLFFLFILAVFLKMQCSLERVFFPPILQCCLVFCCKNKNKLRYDESFFQLRIEKCWPWNYHVMILTQGLHYMFLCKKEYQDFDAFQSVLNACIKVHLLCTYINYFAFVIKISYFKKISKLWWKWTQFQQTKLC